MAINLDEIHNLQYKLELARKLIEDGQKIQIDLLNDVIDQNRKIWDLEYKLKKSEEENCELRMKLSEKLFETNFLDNILENLDNNIFDSNN